MRPVKSKVSFTRRDKSAMDDGDGGLESAGLDSLPGIE